MKTDEILKAIRYVAIGGASFVFMVFTGIALALPHCYVEDLDRGTLMYFEANC